MKAKKKVNSKMLKKDDLEKYFKDLPKPIVNHSKRVEEISDYLIKQFELEDWYIDLDIDTKSFLSAIYYHDIGKSKIKKEYLYRDLCNGPYELGLYLEHIKEGLFIIDDPDIEKFMKDNPNNFKTYLYQAIKYHHGPVDNEFPFIGMIAYVADKLDNSCYKVAADTVVELNEETFGLIVERLIVDFAKKKVDENIINLFKSKQFVNNLCEALNHLFARSISRSKYGIILASYDIYDCFKYNDASSQEDAERKLEECEVYARKLTYNLNSRYYGKVFHDDLIYAAMKNRLAKQLETYFLDDIIDELSIKSYDFSYLTFITLSPESLNKFNIKKIQEIARNNNVDYTKLGILIDVYEQEFTAAQLNAIEEFKKFGIKIGINNARSEYINIFKEINVDYAFYNNSNDIEMDELFIELLQSMGTIIVLSKKSNDKYRYVCSNESNIRKLLKSKVGDVFDNG